MKAQFFILWLMISFLLPSFSIFASEPQKGGAQQIIRSFPVKFAIKDVQEYPDGETQRHIYFGFAMDSLSRNFQEHEKITIHSIRINSMEQHLNNAIRHHLPNKTVIKSIHFLDVFDRDQLAYIEAALRGNRVNLTRNLLHSSLISSLYEEIQIQGETIINQLINETR